MPLTRNGYLPRLIDPVIARDLRAFGAVSVEGPKWCGKTWSCLNQAESAFMVMDPEGGFANRQIALLDPGTALAGAAPRLIDEWQEAPGLWDAVRFRVDQGHDRGRFLLSGSSKPRPGARLHSGTGRIARRRLRPMSLVESGDSTGAVSLARLVEGDSIRPAKSSLSLGRLTELICRGGWPGSLNLDINDAPAVARDYINHLADEDMPLAGVTVRNPARVRALLRALARHTASPVQIPTLRRDIAEAFGPAASDKTIRRYLDALRSLFVLEEIPAWLAHLRSRTAVRQTPKRLLADPSLAAAALGAGPAHLGADLRTLGLVFESLCLRDLATLADGVDATVAYYRDDTGLEADAILTWPDGRWGAFEAKLGHHEVDSAAQQLVALSRKVQKNGHSPPSVLAVIVGVAGLASTRPDGVQVIPADQLGP
ncbi:MAG: DUF4143 domain-containing protein [Bifidobacteriaceae bacterium]|jgi:predicted AAA+ superfamily ATPase|nr:DUF4143 domain-containing protein [Bifidobacteriaceae bacterium]